MGIKFVDDAEFKGLSYGRILEEVTSSDWTLMF